MSNSNVHSNKQEFIKHLELIRDLEAEKPAEEMDVSLVKTCVELILEMRGENIYLSTEEVKEKVRNIPFVEETTTLNTPPESVKGRSTKVKSRKIFLIAAIISILVAVFALTSIAFEWNIFDELKERFGTVANSPVDEEIDANGITVVSNGKNVRYESLEEFFAIKNIQLLYPNELSTNMELVKIVFDKLNGKERVTFVYNNAELTYFVVLDETIVDDIKNTSTQILEIENIVCYITEMTDIGITQIYFEYNGDLYYLNYTDKETLIEIIENLKESK